MPGCYVHIPFCARRCPYCDFAVSVNTRAEFRAAYVAALQNEVKTELAAEREPLQTVFFGGGTPTQLPAATLGQILEPLRERCEAGAEISLEANPENLDLPALRVLRASGFNRLSLGAQSFDANELRVLGRAHDGERIETVVRDARRAGFCNLSLDLIYGAPGTSLAAWKRTLERALKLEPQHISAYSLTVEDGTAFGRAVRRQEMSAPDDDFLGELMELTAQTLDDAGFERYEVSNWAKPGFESRHNRNYWRGGDYLGLGCGAHGHRDGHRFWNERDAKTYVHRMEREGTARAGQERLSPGERATEIVALGLRCREGFCLDALSQIGHMDARAALGRPLAALLAAGTLRQNGARITPAPGAMALADGLAARLVRGL